MSVALASIFIAVSGHEHFLGDIQLKEMKEKINNEYFFWIRNEYGMFSYFLFFSKNSLLSEFGR